MGAPQAAVLSVHRQLGDSLRRLAESQVQLFHAHVEARLSAEGRPEHSWSDDLNQVAASLMASLELAGLAQRRPVHPPAIAFLDLTGYTNLTEERGDRAAAELAAPSPQPSAATEAGLVYVLLARRGRRWWPARSTLRPGGNPPGASGVFARSTHERR